MSDVHALKHWKTYDAVRFVLSSIFLPQSRFLCYRVDFFYYRVDFFTTESFSLLQSRFPLLRLQQSRLLYWRVIFFTTESVSLVQSRFLYYRMPFQAQPKPECFRAEPGGSGESIQTFSYETKNTRIHIASPEVCIP